MHVWCIVIEILTQKTVCCKCSLFYDLFCSDRLIGVVEIDLNKTVLRNLDLSLNSIDFKVLATYAFLSAEKRN